MKRHALLDQTAKALLAHCDTLADVRAVYAYGSYARGAVGPTSDLDVLVIRETELRRLDRDLDIRKAVPGPAWMDILVVTPREYVTDLRANSMGASILREAVLLKEYDGGEHRRHAG